MVWFFWSYGKIKDDIAENVNEVMRRTRNTD